jgi:hypothetical protein
MPVHAAACSMRIAGLCECGGGLCARARRGQCSSQPTTGYSFPMGGFGVSARAKAGVRRATASGRLDAFVGDKRSSSGVVHEITMAGATRLQCRFGCSAYLANSVSFWQMTRACGIYASMCT